jgi:hypothetical protein
VLWGWGAAGLDRLQWVLAPNCTSDDAGRRVLIQRLIAPLRFENVQAFDGFLVNGMLFCAQQHNGQLDMASRLEIPIDMIDPISQVKKPGDYGTIVVRRVSLLVL